MGTILCMPQMWFPQEKPSNQRKTRRQLCWSSKQKPSRQRATARFSVLHKKKSTLFGLMVHAPQRLHGSNSAARTNCADGRVFSQAVPKRCQWKIDVWIRESSGPESFEYFELKVFLRGLRKKQHRLGAAWSIQKGFNQRLCIETALTQKSSHGHCLEDLAVLTQGKSSGRLQPSSQLDFQQSEMAYLVVSHMLQMHSPSKLRVCCSFHEV